MGHPVLNNSSHIVINIYCWIGDGFWMSPYRGTESLIAKHLGGRRVERLTDIETGRESMCLFRRPNVWTQDSTRLHSLWLLLRIESTCVQLFVVNRKVQRSNPSVICCTLLDASIVGICGFRKQFEVVRKCSVMKFRYNLLNFRKKLLFGNARSVDASIPLTVSTAPAKHQLRDAEFNMGEPECRWGLWQ